MNIVENQKDIFPRHTDTMHLFARQGGYGIHAIALLLVVEPKLYLNANQNEILVHTPAVHYKAPLHISHKSNTTNAKKLDLSRCLDLIPPICFFNPTPNILRLCRRFPIREWAR